MKSFSFQYFRELSTFCWREYPAWTYSVILGVAGKVNSCIYCGIYSQSSHLGPIIGYGIPPIRHQLGYKAVAETPRSYPCM